MFHSKRLLALTMTLAFETSSFADISEKSGGWAHERKVAIPSAPVNQTQSSNGVGRSPVLPKSIEAVTSGLHEGLGSSLSHCHPTAGVTIPVKMISNLPIMPGRVNGSRSLNVILDSGAALSVVSPEVANKMGLQSSTSIQAGGFGEGSDQTLRLVDSASLAWGPDDASIRLSNERIAVLPIDYIGAQIGHQIHALFGSNVFQSFRITLDYAHENVTFAPFDEPCTPDAAAIPIEIAGNVPIVEAEIAGRNGLLVKAKFVVDIGTTGAAILSKRFLDDHPALLEDAPLVVSPPFSAVGGKIESKLVRLSRLRIGGHDLDGPVAVIPDQPAGILASPGIAGLLGGEILRRFTVTWDYGSHRMWLVPNGRLHAPFEADASGLHLIAKGSKLAQIYVDAVLPRSPAALADVQVGDRIVSLNGRSQPLWGMMRDLMVPKTKVTLLVERNGKLLRITVLLAGLV